MLECVGSPPGTRPLVLCFGAGLCLLFCSPIPWCLGDDLAFPRHVINVDSEFTAAAVADVNRDGKLDIVCGASRVPRRARETTPLPRCGNVGRRAAQWLQQRLGCASA